MKVYDLEHHYYNNELIDYLKSRKTPPMLEGNLLTYHKGAYLSYDENMSFWEGLTTLKVITDLDTIRIKHIDSAGITTAVLSSSPIIESLSKEEAIKYARATNDAIAAAVKRHPDKYLGTICLPTPYVEDAIKELERAVKVLGLKYWHTHSNYGNINLSDDRFIPLFAKCEELGVPIYIHPHNPTCEYLLDSGMMFSSAGFGFAVDVMKTSLNIILKGRLDQFPKTKLILGHMGEYYPYCLKRLDNRFFFMPDPDVKCKHKFEYYFKNKNIFMTTSGIDDPDVVLFVINKIGIDSILFGSDYPYEEPSSKVAFINNLPISEEDKEKIFYKNAEKYILK